MRNKLFVKNAMILTGTSFVLRGIGIFFRIYMAAKIGAEGMGLYQLVFSVYVLAAAAGSGLPAAVIAKLSSLPPDRSRLKPLFFAITMSALALSVSGVVFFLSADMVSEVLLSDVRTALSLKILCFSLPFMGASACIRGYFISEHNTTIPSAAQLFEQLVRIGVIAALLVQFGAADLKYACAAVIFGDCVAEFASFIFYVISLALSASKKERAGYIPPFRREMLSASLPITGSRYMSTILHSAENMIIPGCLAVGLASTEAAVAEFGMLKGMAMPLLFFPASFLTALSTLLLPEIAEAYSSGNHAKVRKSCLGAIGIVLIASIPIMGNFWLFGREIAQIVYKSDGVGFIVTALAPIVPFMYLESVCDGILKGLTQQAHSLLYNIIDSVVRIAAIFIFVPKFGLTGFLWIMIFSNIFTSSMNIRRLLIVAKIKLPFGQFVLTPLAVTGFSLLVGRFLGRMLPGGILSTAATVMISLAVYLLIIWLIWRRRGGISTLWKLK